MSINNQKSLFGFKEMLPKTKVPISKEKILEAQRLIEKNDGKGAAEVLRGLRDSLERYERRISNKKGGD